MLRHEFQTIFMIRHPYLKLEIRNLKSKKLRHEFQTIFMIRHPYLKFEI